MAQSHWCFFWRIRASDRVNPGYSVNKKQCLYYIRKANIHCDKMTRATTDCTRRFCKLLQPKVIETPLDTLEALQLLLESRPER